MTSVTAHDYAWLRSSPFLRHAVEAGYVLTLARGVLPDEVLRVMGAEPLGVGPGLDALIEREGDLRDETDHWDESFVAGVLPVPGTGGAWSLVLHFAGGVGMRPEFLEALSAGGRAVSHSSNGGKPIDLFDWYEDGELRTGFEAPTLRYGSTPDALLPVMRETGFDLSEDRGSTPRGDAKAAVFALAERLTGVRVTERLLREAEYRLGHVPEG